MTTSDDHDALGRLDDPAFAATLHVAWRAVRDQGGSIDIVAKVVGVSTDLVVGYALGRRSREIEPDTIAINHDGEIVVVRADETAVVTRVAPEDLARIGCEMVVAAARLRSASLGGWLK